MRTGPRWPEGGKSSAFAEQETVGGDAQRGVMVEATPAAPLVVSQPKFLLEVLVIPLNPPAQLGGIDQRTPADAGGQRGEEVLRRLGLVGRPLDQAPFLRTWRGALAIAMRGTHAHGGEARGELGVAAFAPGDAPPRLLRQVQRQLPG